MINSAKNVIWQDEPLFDGAFVKNMGIDIGFKLIDKYLTALFTNQDLSCLDLSEFGITCPPEEKHALFCHLFKTLLESQKQLAIQLGQFKSFVSNIDTSKEVINDEKVKASSTSNAAKYLIEAIAGPPGKIAYNSVTDKVYISGLVPIGATMTISKTRINDFDGTGLGKVETDLAGWQIRNGNKGTENVLGRIPMYTDALANAGKKEGANSFVVDKTNMKSFTFPITGSINEALTDPVIVESPYQVVTKHFGTGADRKVVVLDNGDLYYSKSKPVNVRHTHAFNMNVALDNPQPTPIVVIPEHVKEIPIQYVGV